MWTQIFSKINAEDAYKNFGETEEPNLNEIKNCIQNEVENPPEQQFFIKNFIEFGCFNFILNNKIVYNGN